MKYLILGDGLLGKEMVKQTGWDYISRKKDGMDITDILTYSHLIKERSPDVVINCIANTETYTKSKQITWDVNYKGVYNLINLSKTIGFKLVHMSTDYVYAENKYNVSEDDILQPAFNWYAHTKMLGDRLIELMIKEEDYLILRGTHKEKPFPYQYAWDQIGNFDYVDIMCGLYVKLITKGAVGVYNVGTEVKTIYDLALRTNPEVIVITTPSHVPKDVTMKIDKMKKFLAND